MRRTQDQSIWSLKKRMIFHVLLEEILILLTFQMQLLSWKKMRTKKLQQFITNLKKINESAEEIQALSHLRNVKREFRCHQL
jgi:hypothetical protein